MWLVDGNRYFPCDGLVEGGVLDEDDGLTVGEGGGTEELDKMPEKGVKWKRGRETKFL